MNIRKNEGFPTCILRIPIPEYGQSKAPLVQSGPSKLKLIAFFKNSLQNHLVHYLTIISFVSDSQVTIFEFKFKTMTMNKHQGSLRNFSGTSFGARSIDRIPE